MAHNNITLPAPQSSRLAAEVVAAAMFLFALQKLKSFLLLFVNIFRRAFCCFRRRRRQSRDEPLSHIVVKEHASTNELEQWNDWEFKNRKPASVEEHIEYYRQQQAKLRQLSDNVDDGDEKPDDDPFLDMAPQITKQKKVFIANGSNQMHSDSGQYSLSLAADPVVSTTNELINWDENSAWEEDALELDTGELLRQKKREERERRLLEQKRMEKPGRPNLGAKLVT